MIKIDAATLLQMINRVKKFASTDNEFILNTVHIHTLNGYLWAEATDRYKAAGVKGPACSEEFNTAIYLRDIQRLAYLLRWFKGGTVEFFTSTRNDKKGKRDTEHIIHVSVRYDKTGVEVDFIARTDYPPIHKLPEIKKGMKKPHADGSSYNLRQLATVAGIAEQGFFIPQGEKKGLLVAEDCWAILMPCRTTGRKTDSVWDHFIKELTNTCPSRKEEE